ncbi:RagB/SusD family nutrient uptake outer membrane protein [Myroides fluvii]|uniref:RagB/SusD family nutrient uptake outer membrane protein n=1 Tax=Myroides fluvii TaxID=2572594 RepID=UPI00131C5BE2|nr:RagB/SusD family nutrient uptake outer membrane protein [Myroides fluvii]
MSKVNYFCIFLFLCCISCSELDQDPVSTVSSEAVFNSEKGLELYAKSFYQILPTTNEILRGDNMADFIVRKDVPNFFRPGAFGPKQSSGWTWGQLRNVNYFLEHNISKQIDLETKNHYNGIARFFRALFYFEKVKRFGDVPWINKTLDVDDPLLYGTRDSRVVVIDSVMKDLDYAFTHIRTSKDATKTLITKEVAAAFKARIALFEGTYRKYHTELNLTATADQLLHQAVKASELVIESGVYNLNTKSDKPYRDLFISNQPTNEEFVLVNAYDKELGVLHDANWYYTSASYGDRISFTRSFMNTFLNRDGTTFTANQTYKTKSFVEEIENRDGRLAQLIRTKGYQRNVGGNLTLTPPVFSYTYSGYQPIKWVKDDVFYDSGRNNDNVVPVMRYAEVLLNYAEALAELNLMSEEHWQHTIGKLRARAGIQNSERKPQVVDTYLQTTFYTQVSDPILLEVRRERAIELALEGFRFDDVVRWKMGQLYEKGRNGMYVKQLDEPLDLNSDGVLDVVFYIGKPKDQIPGVQYVNVDPSKGGLRLSETTHGELEWLWNDPIQWEDKFYLYPIPEKDLLINTNLKQNPGW